MSTNWNIFVFIFLCIELAFCQAQGPIVNTTLGQVRGVPADDGDYTMYLGIPFAKVNEDNPFGEAIPQPPFDGIFEANDDSAICPQEEEFNHTIVGSLDCLHLNIHVPSTASPTNLRPVFVWIFGGGFTLGFYGRFLYGPKFLVRHDIVVVSINYRLGPYGFMCLDIPEVPGNQGLKDQLMALRWLQDNIANFGGDPNKITIAGNSAGSMSVDQHILHKNRGPKYFDQAILQSGTAFIPISFDTPKDYPQRLALNLGFETDDVYEAISFLAKVDPLVVIETGLHAGLVAGLCVEKEFEGIEPFITEDHLTVSKIPEVKDIPVMIGFMNDEALEVTHNGIGDFGAITFNLIMSFVFNPLHPKFKFILQTTRTFYFGDENIDDDQLQEYTDFMGDLLFVYPTFRSMDRFLASDIEKMYLFKFSYAGERNFVKHRENITAGGAAHADELGYLFDISYMDEPNDEDQRVVDAKTTMWANFVKYGDPTPQLSDLIPYKWEAISPGSPQHYMEIDLQLRVGNRPLRERMIFWELIYELYGDAQNTSVDPNSEVYKFLKQSGFIY